MQSGGTKGQCPIPQPVTNKAGVTLVFKLNKIEQVEGSKNG